MEMQILSWNRRFFLYRRVLLSDIDVKVQAIQEWNPQYLHQIYITIVVIKLFSVVTSQD